MPEPLKIKENTKKLCDFVQDKFISGELDNNSLLQLFEVMGQYLNLQTIPDYAKRTGLTYNGVKSTRMIKEIFGVKFVIDND